MGQSSFYSPEFVNIPKSILFEKQQFSLDFVNMGNPHIVVLVDKVNRINLHNFANEIYKSIGKEINVHLFSQINKEKLKMRSYERGAGETLACGSGACAVFAIAKKKACITDSISISQKGGNIQVFAEYEDIYLKGTANFICFGDYYCDEK